MSLGDRIFAAGYDPLSARWEERHGAKLRKKLLEPAQGRVLEIGVGTGFSLPHYPPVDELVAADPSEPMLRRARRRAADTGRDVTFVEVPADQLPFEDDSFDTVVSMLVLCTVESQQRALQEIRRVLRPKRTVSVLRARSLRGSEACALAGPARAHLGGGRQRLPSQPAHA